MRAELADTPARTEATLLHFGARILLVLQPLLYLVLACVVTFWPLCNESQAIISTERFGKLGRCPWQTA